MSNRIYSSRLDFSPGWVIKDQRYAKPGAPSEMNNTQLDLLAEGALRPTWGMVPFAFDGLIGEGGQFKRDAATGRRPGISGIDRIKVGDAGEEDTMIATAQVGTASVFYWITAPDATVKKMNFPWGVTYSFPAVKSKGVRFAKHDLCYLMGEAESTTFPVTVAKVSGNGTVADTGNTLWTYTPPATAGVDTMTITFTHDVTSEVHTLTFVFTVTDYPYELTPYPTYEIQRKTPLVFWEPSSTLVVDQVLPAPSPQYLTYVTTFTPAGGPYTSSAGNRLGAYTVLSTGSANQPYDSINKIPRVYWEDETGYCLVNEEFDGATLGLGTHSYYYPCSPVNPGFGTGSTDQGMSAAMKRINTVSGTSQPQAGPLGIWKSATMNGKAYFFNGYSGTAFSVDVSTPTVIGTIGLDRLDASSMTLSTYTNNQSPPTGSYRYWVSTINAEGEESGVSYPATGPIHAGISQSILIENIPFGANSITYLYRSMAGDKSPFFLKRLTGTPGSTTSFSDETPDDELGDLPWAHGDLPPYDLFCPVVYYDRLWGLGTRPGVDGAVRTTLFWSDINNPESWWWDGNWANVYGDDGDEVTALVRDKTGLLVFKNSHLYLMAGRTPDEISFVELTVEDSDTGVGCPHPNAVIATDFGVFFYWNRGMYRYFQGQVVKVSEPIAPMLEGEEVLFPSTYSTAWPYYGRVDDWSVTLDYDPISQVVYFGCQGYFPDQYPAPSGYQNTAYLDVGGPPESPDPASDPGKTHEATFLLDVLNARWIGMYNFHFGFFRRARIKLYDQWHTRTTQNSSVGDALICGLMSANNKHYLGFNVHHPLMVVPATALMNTVPVWHNVKFRPISGNLGPYSSKRFVYVDYLMDDDGAQYNSAASVVTSRIYLDGEANTPDSVSTLSVQGGSIYSTQIRHNLGLVGAEVEVLMEFDSEALGGVARLFEYGIGWQNLGRERAERPGAAPSTPPGAPAVTGMPKALR